MGVTQTTSTLTAIKPSQQAAGRTVSSTEREAAAEALNTLEVGYDRYGSKRYDRRKQYCKPGIRWPVTSELVLFVNDAQREIALLKPDAVLPTPLSLSPQAVYSR